jgi:hypothetical protein
LYYLPNAHGDVTQLLNQKAEVIKDYRYDAFGQEEAPESSKRLKFLPAIASQNFN